MKNNNIPPSQTFYPHGIRFLSGPLSWPETGISPDGFLKLCGTDSIHTGLKSRSMSVNDELPQSPLGKQAPSE